MKQKTLQFYVIAAMMLCGIAIYQMMHITGIVMYPDEFGYWSNAAQWLGFDWSDITSLQSYYSFGYSILLFPLLKWIENPFVLYKIAILLNIVFVYLHAVLLWKITGAMEEEKQESNILYCLIAAFYPSVIFFMQLTMTESLLSLLFLLIIWLLIKSRQTEKIIYDFLAVLALGYIYFVHMRSLGVLAAGGIYYLYDFIKGTKRKKINLLIIFAVFGILFLIGNGMKQALLIGNYQNVSDHLIRANTYGGQVNKIKAMFTIQGIGNFLISGMGKLLYLGLATCGTFYFGMWHLVKKAGKDMTAMFILLSVVFTFLISSLYTMGGGRADAYIYGRYNEMVIPIVVYFGLREMAVHKKIFRVTTIWVLIQGAMAVLVYSKMSQADPRYFQGFFTVGISYGIKEFMSSIWNYIFYPLVYGSIGMILLAVVMGWFIRKKKSLEIYLLLLLTLFLYTGISAGQKYLYDHSFDTGADMALALRVKEKLEPGDEVFFLNSKTEAQYIGSVQFCLRENPVRNLQQDIVEESKKFIFLYADNPLKGELAHLFNKKMETFHLTLYYNK